jgi:hypothetical protein
MDVPRGGNAHFKESWKSRRILPSATSCGASRDGHRMGSRWSSRTCASATGSGISGLGATSPPRAATSRTMTYISIFTSTNLPASAGSYSVCTSMIGGSRTVFAHQRRQRWCQYRRRCQYQRRRHKTVSMLLSSADTRWSRGATAGSALAAPTMTARIPTDISTDVMNVRRSMASFSSRKRMTPKTIRHSVEMRSLSLSAPAPRRPFGGLRLSIEKETFSKARTARSVCSQLTRAVLKTRSL